MASIPLPALHVNVPAPAPDPLEQYSRLAAIQQQQQMRPLQLQEAQNQVQAGQLENQKALQAQKDQQGLTSAMQGWDGKDYNDIFSAAVKNGVSAQSIIGLKSKVLEQQQSIANTLKATADAGQAQINTIKTKGDLLNGALSPLVDPKQVPDAQLPQALQSTAQDLVQKGVLDPQHAQQVGQ